jgi:uncharacterized protein
MKRLLITAVLCLGLTGPAWGADFDKGVAAYERGDYATALREFRPLAEQGDASAQYNLGLMYSNGRGVTQDYKAAVMWYRRAAEQGDAKAQTNLGVMYGNGSGVLQDNIYAHMWSNIAAASGHKTAAGNRDFIAKRMTSADVSAAQELARECVRKKYKWC